MSMTRKDFKAIAKILREYTDQSDFDFPLVQVLANYFKEVNPNFNRCKFMEAAGYTDE